MAIEPLRLRRLRIEAAARASRSPLYKWQTENYDLIVSIIGASAQNWEPIRRMAVEAGIQDAKDREPTLRLMAKTWFKVRRSHANSSTVEKGPKVQVEPPLDGRVGKALPTNRPPAVSRAEKELPDSRSEKVLVASTSGTLISSMEEIRQPSPPELATPQRKAPSTQPDYPYANETGEENVARVLAELRARSNRRNGVF